MSVNANASIRVRVKTDAMGRMERMERMAIMATMATMA